MKKTLLFLLLLFMGASAVLVSCKDDDDNDGGGSSSPVASASYVGGSPESSNARQVVGVGGYSFIYNDDDILSRISSSSTSSSVSYSITKDPYAVIEKGSSRYESTKISDFRFNSQGYIVSMRVAQLERDDDSYTDETVGQEEEVEVNTYNFSYNGAGQMTSVSVSYEETDLDEGEVAKGTASYSCSYEDGDLVALSSNATLTYKWEDVSYDEDGWHEETDEISEELTISSHYTQENTYMQNVQNLFDLPLFRIFGPLGWYGKGSKHLVKAYTEKTTYSESIDGETKTQTFKNSYTLSQAECDEDGFITYYTNIGTIEYK